MSQANIVLPLTWADEAISSPCQPEYAVIGHSLVALLYLQNASYSWKLCNNNPHKFSGDRHQVHMWL
jgi:hypothetical protein